MEQDTRQKNAIIDKFSLCSFRTDINPMCGNKPTRNTKFIERYLEFPILVAARSQAWVFGCSFAGIVGLNLAWGHGYLSIVSVLCCQVEVSASG
jgi:hypothetical protein